MYSSFAIVLLTVTSTTGSLAADGATEPRGAVVRTTVTKAKVAGGRPVPNGNLVGTGSSELLAVNFALQGNSCISFDSSLDFMGADQLQLL